LNAPATAERVLWALESVNEGSALGAGILAEDDLGSAQTLAVPVMGAASSGPGDA
jgi:hypothetical protein